VVQIKVPLETPNPFASAAPSVFGVTRQRHFLNHVDGNVVTNSGLTMIPDDRVTRHKLHWRAQRTAPRYPTICGTTAETDLTPKPCVTSSALCSASRLCSTS